ncbi:NAD(P)-binding protein [Ceratobasidium sp. AG-Ba]|nr:NAD(P)-binding protein [Ceratobasidium sp. AG-Ba]
MPRILVIGANGYIGNALSLSLVRSGDHTVWGVARTPEKARSLAIQEISPILCPDPIEAGEAWHDVVRKQHIDIIVDASASHGGVLRFLEDIKKLGQERLDIAAKEDVQIQRLGFLYLCGVWLHGDSKLPTSDTIPPGTSFSPAPSITLTADRPRWEQNILKAQGILDVLIVRPALVYGGEARAWAVPFRPILEAIKSGASTAQVPLKEDAAPALIHVDDVASGMHAAVDKLNLIAGTGAYPIFDLTTSHEYFRNIVDKCAKALGFEGKVEYAGPGDNIFLQGFTSSANNTGARARQLLGWMPRKIGMLPQADIYAKAWLAGVSDASSFAQSK